MADELKNLEYGINAGRFHAADEKNAQKAIDLLDRAYKIIYDDGEAVCQSGTECMEWVEEYRAAKGIKHDS